MAYYENSYREREYNFSNELNSLQEVIPLMFNMKKGKHIKKNL